MYAVHFCRWRTPFLPICNTEKISVSGKRILVVNDFTFRLNSLKSGGRYYWKCTVDPCMFRCVYNENLKDLVKVDYVKSRFHIYFIFYHFFVFVNVCSCMHAFFLTKMIIDFSLFLHFLIEEHLVINWFTKCFKISESDEINVEAQWTFKRISFFLFCFLFLIIFSTLVAKWSNVQ